MTLGRLMAPRIAGPYLQQAFAVAAGIVSMVMAVHAAAWI